MLKPTLDFSGKNPVAVMCCSKLHNSEARCPCPGRFGPGAQCTCLSPALYILLFSFFFSSDFLLFHCPVLFCPFSFSQPFFVFSSITYAPLPLGSGQPLLMSPWDMVV